MLEPTHHASPDEMSEADGAARLLRLAGLGAELGADRLSGEARELASRVSEGRFYVACIGQFKRGKSALINALIGEALLPVGVTPVTTVPTVVRFGEQRRARIQGRGADWEEIVTSDLERYVSEEHNPENAKGVRGVEVLAPCPLLSTGLCLVDTPGLGSVFASNTAATHAFIPHIDAALVVLGADPPLGGEELALVEAVGRQVRDLIMVVNKADRTTDAERAAAVRFAQQLVEERLRRALGPVLQVSAAERLEHRGPERDWRKLTAALEQLVQESGRQLIQAACERGVRRLSQQLLAIVREGREALNRPLEDSERRIAGLKETLAAAERSMMELSFLFMAEQRRLSDLLVGRRRAFLASALPEAEREFDGGLLSSAARPLGPAYRRALTSEAEGIARRRVLPWLRTEQADAEAEYRRTASRFVEMGNAFLERLAAAGIPELAPLPHALDPEAGFRARSDFIFLDLIEVAQPASPLRWLADLAFGLVGARSRIEAAARQFLVRLLEINSTRVQSDILNRTEESRRRLEVEIRKLFHEVSRIAEQALSCARSARAAGGEAVRVALARLDNLEREIRTLQPRAPKTG